MNFERAKDLLEENDGAGNTFKATAKPVLIGTAVVGATTMIFSIIMALTNGITENVDKLSLLHAPFFLGLITGGAMIYWFTGASTQAVTTGAYRAVEFIKANIKLEGSEKASVADSKKVVEICTQYAQKGMLNIFMAVFFATLAFAFVEPFFFIGYLISIAIFGLYQAIFMANAGAAWDNAKKIVEVELKQKGTPAACATVVGDTVGDPFKDTSSVALNPVIKFTTLFGLLAVELAVQLTAANRRPLTRVLAAVFFLISFVFVYRSFYGMRIRSTERLRKQIRASVTSSCLVRTLREHRVAVLVGQTALCIGVPDDPAMPACRTAAATVKSSTTRETCRVVSKPGNTVLSCSCPGAWRLLRLAPSENRW